MFSEVTIGQVSGFLFLFILLTTVLSQFMARDPIDSEDVPRTLGAVAERGQKYRLSIVIDLVSHVSIIALAGALYLTFSPFNQSLALLGTLWRAAEGTIIAFSEIFNIVLLSVGRKFVSAEGAEARTLEMMGETIITAENGGHTIGLAFFALGSLIYAILFVSTGTVPLALGWWGIIASLLASIGIWATLIKPNVPVALKTITFLPIIPYEVVLGIWLLLRGGQIGSPG
jgi:hypothetical protein